MELYTIKDDDKVYQKPYIHSSRNRNKKISLEDMQQAAIETELLANKLSESYVKMLGEYWEIIMPNQRLNPTAVLVRRIYNFWRLVFVKDFVLSVRSN